MLYSLVVYGYKEHEIVPKKLFKSSNKALKLFYIFSTDSLQN